VARNCARRDIWRAAARRVGWPQTTIVSWLAHLIYAALVWKERQTARHLRRSGKIRPAGRGQAAEDAHLETGRRGENLAYWYLRRSGYIVIARRRRPGGRAGELDLVGWDGPVLAFVEVKTRTGGEAGPPETAVTREQRRRIMRAAGMYLKRMGRRDVTFRFDQASVYWDPEAGYRVRLVKDAFRGA
jgi:putative endonuclease